MFCQRRQQPICFIAPYISDIICLLLPFMGTIFLRNFCLISPGCPHSITLLIDFAQEFYSTITCAIAHTNLRTFESPEMSSNAGPKMEDDQLSDENRRVRGKNVVKYYGGDDKKMV